MASLAVQTSDRAGITWNLTDNATAAGASGDYFANDGSTLLFIVNGDVADTTLTETLSPTATVDGQAATSRTVTITAGKSYILGPYPTVNYSDVNGNMNLAYSSVTSLKVLPFKPTTS